MKFEKPIAWILLGFNVVTTQATDLADAAARMQPGTWQEFTTLNLANDTLLFKNVNGDLWYGDMHTTWSNYLAWNPASQELFWAGAPHLQPFGFIRYSAATNRWTNETNAPDCMRLPGYTGCFNHGYDDGTMDPVQGIFYYQSMGRIMAYKVSTGIWTEWNQTGLSAARASALEYLPSGKLAYVIGTAVGDGGLVQLIDPTTHQIQTVAKDLAMGDYSNTAEYSFVHSKLYFGGGGGAGSRAFFSMNDSNRVTRLADAPENFDCIRSSLAVDPVTGTPLLLANSNKYYAYQAGSNTWTELTSPPRALNSTTNAVAVMATAIPEHGVVFYMSPPQKKVYLYKHAASSSVRNLSRRASSGFRLPALWQWDFNGRKNP